MNCRRGLRASPYCITEEETHFSIKKRKIPDPILCYPIDTASESSLAGIVQELGDSPKKALCRADPLEARFDHSDEGTASARNKRRGALEIEELGRWANNAPAMT